MALVICISFLLSSCEDLDADTKVEVVDPERHYYPIVQGQELEIVYEVKNIGESPLLISEILPSCGCIIVNDIRNHIPAQESLFLRMTYNSNKNIGLVNHQIYIYGNIEGVKKDSSLKLEFDVHVVPDGLYTRDYEELYKEQIEREGGFKQMTDGDESNKGYYIEIDN